ncbi:TPA: glycosyltransferase [Vibrio metschnikovii]
MNKVIIILPSLGGGGAEKNAVAVANYLSRNYLVEIVCCYKNEETKSREDLDKRVSVRFLEKNKVIHALYDIYKLIRKEKPKAVITTVAYFSLLFSVIIPFLPSSVNYICRETNIPEIYGAQKGLAYRFLSNIIYRYCYRNYNIVVCQSDDMLSSIQCVTKLPQTSLVKINNPALISNNRYDNSFKLPDDIPFNSQEYFIAAGRLTYQKGFDLLIDDFYKSTLRQRGFKLLIAGTGPDEKSLKLRVRDLDLENDIHFLGFRNDVESLIANARGFILSSRFEGFPNVVLEALTLGCPVLGKDCPGGLRELIKVDINGALYDENFIDVAESFLNTEFNKEIIISDVKNRFDLNTLFYKYHELIER